MAVLAVNVTNISKPLLPELLRNPPLMPAAIFVKAVPVFPIAGYK
jgi:hypothetical protein